jgi:sirohydrochlorin ferrochelatase
MLKEAVLLVGHGSRLEEANEALAGLCRHVAGKRPGKMVTHAFMQIASPSLGEALAELADAGVEQVTVVPIFLYAGVHIRDDLPEILANAAEQYPRLQVILAPVLGIDERMAEIVWERVDAAPRIEES